MITLENLKNPLAALSPACDGKGMPILTHIHLEPLPGGELRLTASNLEMQISTLAAADHQDDAPMCLEYQKLLAYSRISDQISITRDGDKAKIKAKTRATINTLPADNFPAMTGDTDGTTVTLPAASLAKAIGDVIYAAASADVRYYLNGVLLRIDAGQISLIASDGHRLAQATWSADTDATVNCIIPHKTAQALAKTFTAGDVALTLSRNAIAAKNPSTTLLGKCIDAKYPDFAKVFNQPRPNTARADSKPLMAAIDAVSITANTEHHGIRAAFDSTLQLAAHNATGEESDLSMPIDYTGKPIELGFCARYLKDALAKIDGIATLQIDANGSSLIVQGDDQSRLHVVMPMRI